MFACTLAECPPGLFLFRDCLGFKTEYRTPNGNSEAYVVASGERFWGGTATAEECENLMVIPVELIDARALRLAGVPDDD